MQIICPKSFVKTWVGESYKREKNICKHSGYVNHLSVVRNLQTIRYVNHYDVWVLHDLKGILNGLYYHLRFSAITMAYFKLERSQAMKNGLLTTNWYGKMQWNIVSYSKSQSAFEGDAVYLVGLDWFITSSFCKIRRWLPTSTVPNFNWSHRSMKTSEIGQSDGCRLPSGHNAKPHVALQTR